jgi:hypothetical protein
MPCNSKLSLESKGVIRFEVSILSYICKKKNYAFADVLSPQKQFGPHIANTQIAKNI